MSDICLLADRPELIEPVGLLRWREWGRAPEPADPAFWVDVARAEAGRDGLPFTLVAVDAGGRAAGVVGLGEFDQEELRGRGPWVTGMVVEPGERGRGVGRALMAALEARAAELGFRRLWVSTTEATGFYERCGWRHVGTAHTAVEGPMAVLTRSITGVDQADAVGEDHGLDAVAEVELHQDAGHVGLDGLRADHQGGRDLGVGQPGRDQAQDLQLARRQRVDSGRC